MKGLPLEFGIGVRGPKCLNDGATRWSKKFSDGFSRFDTLPAVTDTQPASHVAVAITLNAKASSLKMKFLIGRVLTTSRRYASSRLMGLVQERLTPLGVRVVGLESWTWTQVGLESDFLRTWT